VARVPRPLLLAIAGALACFALSFHAERAPTAMLHAVPLALVALGLAFIALWMRLRAPAVQLFERERCRGWIRAINARAYTIYLWGPFGNDMARRVVRPHTVPTYLFEFALSLTFLVLLVRLFGPVEDWAARRAPRGRPAPGEACVAPEPPSA
jgi:peptidoglycan/LPS O-acetylase OafA/YrhL